MEFVISLTLSLNLLIVVFGSQSFHYSFLAQPKKDYTQEGGEKGYTNAQADAGADCGNLVTSCC